LHQIYPLPDYFYTIIPDEYKKKSTQEGMMKKIMILILKILGALVPVIYFYRAFKSRSLPCPKGRHKPPKEKDHLTRGSFATFKDYLEEEKAFLDRLFDEAAVNEPGPDDSYNRYVEKSESSPYKNGENLNCSFQCSPEQGKERGGILLVHGLTDSPYHLRAIADIFREKGYYVIGIRLPGHGTYPGALLDVKWEHWYEAVTFGAKMVKKEISNYKDPKFFVGGFSTGGALTLKYVLDKLISNDDDGKPDKLFLFSPAIAVPWEAEFADWHIFVSWMSFFERFKWESIKPEYDPFKYNSFPKNAGDQIHELTKVNEKRVKKVVSDEKLLQKAPPIYAFQSLVDATVIPEDLIVLFNEIGTEESELVLFDFNRLYEAFINAADADKLLAATKERSDFKSRLVVVTNEEKSADVKFTWYFGKKETWGWGNSKLSWPGHVFALSHGCIPIPPEDGYYGENSELGGLNAKGEKKLLAISPSALIRVRYNPFFSLVKERIEAVLKVTAKE
jgi:alpha-beta hydrolase superfamily lysophospholipase